MHIPNQLVFRWSSDNTPWIGSCSSCWLGPALSSICFSSIKVKFILFHHLASPETWTYWTNLACLSCSASSYENWTQPPIQALQERLEYSMFWLITASAAARALSSSCWWGSLGFYVNFVIKTLFETIVREEVLWAEMLTLAWIGTL